MITTVFITFIRELEKMEKSREITERVAVETTRRFHEKNLYFFEEYICGRKK